MPSAKQLRIAVEQAAALLVAEPVGGRERRELRRPQDLVRVGAADADERALVAQQRVQLPAARERGRERRVVERRLERLGAEVREVLRQLGRRQQPHAHRLARHALAHDELALVLEAHREHGARRALLARLDVGQLARRHEVDREHEVVVGREEQVLAAPLARPSAVAREPRQRRRRRLDHGEVRHRHIAHRRAGDEGVERFGERLELGQLGHAVIVRGRWRMASSRKCAGASSRRATACTR